MTSPRSIDSFATMTPESCPTKSAMAVVASKQEPTESFFSGPSSFSSASILYGTKVNKNIKKRHRISSYIPATNDVRQRVLSARHLRLKSVQNQLGLAQHRIAELTDELRALRTMHKRQNVALAKYEATNAELPRLLNAHAEELRVWQTKYRNLKASHREISLKLKQKETIIHNLAEENKFFNQLNKDKNLAERQHLAEKLEILQNRLHDRENQMKMVERRAHLEIKGLKQQLINEQKKVKEILQKLEKARLDVSSYRKMDELKLTDKMSQLNIKSSNSKIDLKSTPAIGLKKMTKDKMPEPIALQRASKSKTPSPVLDATNGGGGGVDGVNGNANDEDEIDFPISHRSQKSNSSNSINVLFTAQRTVRKASSSHSRSSSSSGKPTQRYGSEATNHHVEIIGDGPHIVSKRIETRKRHTSSRQIKMLVNMPGFDVGACGDGYWLSNEREAYAMEIGASAIHHSGDDDDDEAQNADGGTNFHYSDDFDENADEDNDNDNDVGDGDEELDDVVIKHTNLDFDADERVQGEAELTTTSRSNILKIKKQITEDYKQREAFLDTFCRQATSTSIRNGGGGGGVGVGVGVNGDAGADVSPKCNAARKKQLLDALKAIDDDKRCSQDANLY